MTAPRNPDQLIRTFLNEGETDLPDRAYDAVRRDIHRTRQRVVIGPWREPDMSSIARVAIAAAAVVAIGLVWLNFGPKQNNGVGNRPTPSPSASPMAIPAAEDVPLEPGRYRFNQVVPFSASVPSGWSGSASFAVFKNYGPTDAEAGPALAVWEIKNRYVNACTDHTLLSPAPGPGVDELVSALASQPGVSAGPPTAVTIDGYRGKFVELTVTADIDPCGVNGFWLWGDPADHRHVQGTNEMNRIYVLDVDGVRLTFFARVPARTTAADKAELEAIIASIDIER